GRPVGGDGRVLHEGVGGRAVQLDAARVGGGGGAVGGGVRGVPAVGRGLHGEGCARAEDAAAGGGRVAGGARRVGVVSGDRGGSDRHRVAVRVDSAARRGRGAGAGVHRDGVRRDGGAGEGEAGGPRGARPSPARGG